MLQIFYQIEIKRVHIKTCVILFSALSMSLQRIMYEDLKNLKAGFQSNISVFQLENEKGRAPGRALCAKWAREGTF